MNADQSNRDYRERMKTNPVSICLKPFLATGLIKALVTGILLCVQAFPVNAASGIHKEMKPWKIWQMESYTAKYPATSIRSGTSAFDTRKHEMPVFSKVDHKANAVSVGLDMKAARVVSFGNPAVGTFLMQENPEAALDLPLKILVWASPDGTMLSWNDPAWIARRYGIDPENQTVSENAKNVRGHFRKNAGYALKRCR